MLYFQLVFWYNFAYLQYVPACIQIITYMYIHSYADIHTHIHTHIHTYIYTPTHKHTYIHTYIQLHTHTYFHAHTHKHKYVRTYLRTYTHTLLHTFHLTTWFFNSFSIFFQRQFKLQKYRRILAMRDHILSSSTYSHRAYVPFWMYATLHVNKFSYRQLEVKLLSICGTRVFCYTFSLHYTQVYELVLKPVGWYNPSKDGQ